MNTIVGAADPHVLLIDDDPRLRGLVARYLQRESIIVSQADDTSGAEALMRFFQFDLLVVDVMMPGEDGITFASRLREKNNTIPLLMLSAMGSTPDRIQGLNAGVDDYLTKPFDPEELTLRLRAILRRQPRIEETCRFGSLRYQPASGILSGPDGPITLTDAESRLFRVLLEAKGDVLSRPEIAERLGLLGQDRTVDRLISRLRKRLEANGAPFPYLQVVRGEGYRLMIEFGSDVGS